MMVAAGLVAYALVLAVALPRVLAGSTLADRCPRLALCVWQAATVSLVLSVALLAVALVVPVTALSGDVANLLQACVMAIRDQYATPGGAAAGITGIILAATIAARCAWVLIGSARGTRRSRRAHQQALILVGRRGGERGVTVIDDGAVAAYCVPGRGRQVVLTTAALECLDEDQLRAVLAHERAHLRARHHVAVGFAVAMAKAFPMVPLLSTAAAQTAVIVEMLADDAAGRSVKRDSVATALVSLADATAPRATLAAGGPSALRRALRMISPPRPIGSPKLTIGIAAILLMLIAPLVAVSAPAVAARNTNLCPVPAVSSAVSV